MAGHARPVPSINGIFMCFIYLPIHFILITMCLHFLLDMASMWPDRALDRAVSKPEITPQWCCLLASADLCPVVCLERP
jgi:hypothetical protein